MKIVNLTNQKILLYPEGFSDIKIPVEKRDEGKFLSRCIEIPSVGNSHCQISRDSEKMVCTTESRAGKFSVSIATSSVGEVMDLPEPTEGVIYILSQLAYNASWNTRKDVYMIDKPVRTTSGSVIACRGFSRCVYDSHVKSLWSVKVLLEKLLQKDTGNSELFNAVISINKFLKK